MENRHFLQSSTESENSHTSIGRNKHLLHPAHATNNAYNVYNSGNTMNPNANFTSQQYPSTQYAPHAYNTHSNLPHNYANQPTHSTHSTHIHPPAQLNTRPIVAKEVTKVPRADFIESAQGKQYYKEFHKAFLNLKEKHEMGFEKQKAFALNAIETGHSVRTQHYCIFKLNFGIHNCVNARFPINFLFLFINYRVLNCTIFVYIAGCEMANSSGPSGPVQEEQFHG